MSYSSAIKFIDVLCLSGQEMTPTGQRPSLKDSWSWQRWLNVSACSSFKKVKENQKFYKKCGFEAVKLRENIIH